MTALAARLALLAVPFASFLVASPRLTLEQFESPKRLGLAMLAGLLAAGGSARPLRAHPAVAGWLAATVAATTLSPVPLTGWLGGEEYQDGILTIATYAVFLLAGAAAGPADRRRFRAALLAAAGLAMLYALLQRAGGDPFPGERFRHVRAFAGNPDFLAQQMALALPFALTAGGGPALGLTAGCSLVTGLTASRAGALAALTGLLLAGWAVRGRPGMRRTLPLAAGLALGALVAAEAVVPADLSLASRIRTLVAGDGFRIARGDLWRGTARAISERPVPGWGPDALGSVFLRTAPAGWADDAGLGVTARRAHNAVLDQLAATGVIGLGMWLWVLAAALRRRPDPDDEAALTPAIAAVLLHNFFSFGSAGTLPVFWVLVGMRSTPPTARTEPPRFRPLLVPAAVALAALAAVRFAAGAWGYVGHEAERAGASTLSAPAFATAARLAPFDGPSAIRAGRAAELAGLPREALAWFERAAALAPLDGLALGHVGRLRAALGSAARDRTEQEAAHAVLLRAVALAPSQPSLWGAAIMSAQSLGRRDEIPGLLAGLSHAAPGWAAKLLNPGGSVKP